MKNQLKHDILVAENLHGSFSLEALDMHKKLKQFYETSIQARQAGYGASSSDIMHGIEKAIHREEKIIQNIESQLQSGGKR